MGGSGDIHGTVAIGNATQVNVTMQQVVVYVAYLKSYEHMGLAQIRFVLGEHGVG